MVRGKVKVAAEVSLAHFGYNLKRALAVVGLEKLLVALRSFKPDGLPAWGGDCAKGLWPPAVAGVLAWLRTAGCHWTVNGSRSTTFSAPP